MRKVHNNTMVSAAIAMIFSGAATAETNWNAEIGIGYDSNIYRAPSESYVDLAQATTPTVNPKVQTGFFIPFKGSVDYAFALNSKTSLLADYELKTNQYFDSKYNNADETRHVIKLGGEYVFNQVKSRKDALYGGIFFKKVDEFYVDRDSGGDKVLGTTNISDRYKYDSVGIELEYRNRTRDIQYGVGFKGEHRDYVDPKVVAQYDHDYKKVFAKLEIPLSNPTKIYFDLSLANRAYDERLARSLDGRLLTSNPPREYAYKALEATVRHRINGAWVSYVGYEYSTREDTYVGYNSYTGHTFKARLLHKNEFAKTRLALKYKTLDYDNALAFEDIAGGAKTYDSLKASISTEIPQDDNRAIWGEIDYNAVDTNDSRYKYDRFIISAGYKWEY
jgi:hypothetical protein